MFSYTRAEPYRIRVGMMATATGHNGAFRIKRIGAGGYLQVIASNGEGWEHVSVSMSDELPSWSDMCHIKDLFWNEGDAVMQLHPPKSEYVNNHPYCLHLWRPTEGEIPLPPSILVGYKDLNPKDMTETVLVQRRA